MGLLIETADSAHRHQRLLTADSGLARIDPRLKLLAAAEAVAATVLFSGWIVPLAVLLLSLILFRVANISRTRILRRLAPPLVMVTILLAMQWMHSHQLRNLILAPRVVAAVSVLVILSDTTPTHSIFQAMRWFGVPQGWVELALLTHRYSFLLIARARQIADAQLTRLGYAEWRRGLSCAASLAGMVTINGLDQAVRTAQAMELRGYRGSLALGPLPRLSRGAKWTMAIIAILPLIAFILGMER